MTNFNFTALMYPTYTCNFAPLLFNKHNIPSYCSSRFFENVERHDVSNDAIMIFHVL